MNALTVPGDLESLRVIRAFVNEAAHEAGLDKRATYRLVLAVDEVATNIVTHGYQEAQAEGEIHVSVDSSSAALTIMLEDTAPRYDPTQAPEPSDLDAPLEDRQLGGLGVYLVLQGVDKFSYEWLEGINRNSFTMRLPQPTEEQA